MKVGKQESNIEFIRCCTGHPGVYIDVVAIIHIVIACCACHSPILMLSVVVELLNNQLCGVYVVNPLWGRIPVVVFSVTTARVHRDDAGNITPAKQGYSGGGNGYNVKRLACIVDFKLRVPCEDVCGVLIMEVAQQVLAQYSAWGVLDRLLHIVDFSFLRPHIHSNIGRVPALPLFEALIVQRDYAGRCPIV